MTDAPDASTPDSYLGPAINLITQLSAVERRENACDQPRRPLGSADDLVGGDDRWSRRGAVLALPESTGAQCEVGSVDQGADAVE